MNSTKPSPDDWFLYFILLRPSDRLFFTARFTRTRTNAVEYISSFFFLSFVYYTHINASTHYAYNNILYFFSYLSPTRRARSQTVLLRESVSIYIYLLYTHKSLATVTLSQSPQTPLPPSPQYHNLFPPARLRCYIAVCLSPSLRATQLPVLRRTQSLGRTSLYIRIHIRII